MRTTGSTLLMGWAGFSFSPPPPKNPSPPAANRDERNLPGTLGQKAWGKRGGGGRRG